MNKPFTIGGITLDLPEVDADITRSLDEVNVLHEQGQIKSLFMVFTRANGKTGFSVCGDSLHFPTLCLIATGVAEAVEEAFMTVVFNGPDTDTNTNTDTDTDTDTDNEEDDDD